MGSIRHNLLAVAFTVLGSPALASGYTELNAGIAARNRHDADATVKHLTLALSAPDLPSRFIPIARLDRAEAYWAEGRFRDATSDLDTAVGLRHDWYAALVLRADCRAKLGDKNGAAADLTAAIAVRADLTEAFIDRSKLYASEARYQDALDDDTSAAQVEPRLAEPLILRAGVRELAGQFDQALPDLEKARDLTGDRHAFALQIGIVEWALGQADDATDEFDSMSDGALHVYGQLWKVIAEKLTDDSKARLGRALRDDDLTGWPGPIASLYLGKITIDQMRLAEDNNTPLVALGRRCEGDFYAAELALAQHDESGATSMLKAAQDECPIDFLERPAVLLELSRLKPGTGS